MSAAAAFDELLVAERGAPAHTCGPWRAVDNHPNHVCLHVMADVPYMSSAITVEIATLWTPDLHDGARERDADGNWTITPQLWANARLMAAAPELLAALRLALGAMESATDDDHIGFDVEIKAARAAIAKATQP